MTKQRNARKKEQTTLFDALGQQFKIRRTYCDDSDATLYHGDCLDFLPTIPDEAADLIVTSPPYNLGKEYERKLDLDAYLEQQSRVITECIRILSSRGSICWQVGNFVDRGAIIPLDTILYPVFANAGLQMRNRIVWHFEHGLHCTRRFSGRYEVIVWFTKSSDYLFKLDPVRIPQKYPGKKHFKGPKAGEYSCNPLGKNPGDLWVIPNVKHNHIEKTDHPCQFPVELIERLVLSMTHEGSLIVDPFMGVGTTAVAAIRHRRRVAGAETHAPYYHNSLERLRLELAGKLRTRPMGQPVYQPSGNERVANSPFENAAKVGKVGA